MLELSQKGGDGERERRKMGIRLTTMMSEDVSLSKCMIDKARNCNKQKVTWFTCKSVVHQNKFGQSVKNIHIAFNITNHCSINSDHQKGKKRKESKRNESRTKSEKRN
jgi:hypothetical protein